MYINVYILIHDTYWYMIHIDTWCIVYSDYGIEKRQSIGKRQQRLILLNLPLAPQKAQKRHLKEYSKSSKKDIWMNIFTINSSKSSKIHLNEYSWGACTFKKCHSISVEFEDRLPPRLSNENCCFSLFLNRENRFSMLNCHLLKQKVFQCSVLNFRIICLQGCQMKIVV